MNTGAIFHPLERERLSAVHTLGVLDGQAIPELQAAARMAAVICAAPYGSVNIIDRETHYTVASYGSPAMNAPRGSSLCAQAILAGGVVHTSDVQQDSRFSDMPILKLIQPPVRMFVAAPLNTRNGLPIGTLRVYDEVVRDLAPEQLGALSDLAEMVMRIIELRSMAGELHELALRDPLTGLGNRRSLTTLARSDVPQVNALGVIDLNSFKAINDSGGHIVGDQVLRVTAERLRNAVGANGRVTRMGGDEFVVLMAIPGTIDQTIASLLPLLAEPLQIGATTWPISVSIGMVMILSGESWLDAAARADIDLYERKKRAAANLKRTA
jgi:diguanylate cyclase (GGDEF)-like protein